MEHTDFGSFSQVDAAPVTNEFVRALDNIAALAGVQRLKGAALDMLQPLPGQRLVDVGCGTGEDVRTLAIHVGATGQVVGIDPSQVMVDEAQRRTLDPALQVEFRVGDATHLDIDDDSVDGCRSERVFQHLRDPSAALREMARVARPGGRVVVIDTDWGMQAVAGADQDLTARVLASWARNMDNGWSGRRLRGLFVDAGIDEPAIVADTFTSIDGTRPLEPPFTLMAMAVERTGTVSADESQAWLEQLAEAGRRGHFFWATTMFAVGGRVPA